MQLATLTSQNSRLLHALTLAITVGLGLYFVAQCLAPNEPHLRPFAFASEAQWITTQDEAQATACLRKEIFLPGRVRNAWATISADGGFELIVNGNTEGRYFLWRPTRPFQNGLSEAGQRLRQAPPAIALNFPREFQWTGHRNGYLPTYLDLTTGLKRGKNTLALEVESRHSTPAAIMSVQVELLDGRQLVYHTDESWFGEPVPVGVTQDEWTLPATRITKWRTAKAVAAPYRHHWTQIDPNAFSQALQAKKIQLGEPGNESHVDFRHQWTLDSVPATAALRMIVSDQYLVTINGKPVTARAGNKGGMSTGEWMVKPSRLEPLIVGSAQLDPDEVESLFVGTRFESPRHGDPTINDFKRYENTLNRTKDKPSAARRSNLPGDEYDEGAERGRLEDPYGVIERPENRVPIALTQDQSKDAWHLFEVASLLQTGENTINVRLIRDQVAIHQTAWHPSLIVDLGPHVASSEDWQARGASPIAAWSSVIARALPAGSESALPRKQFLGVQSKTQPWSLWCLLLALAIAASTYQFRLSLGPRTITGLVTLASLLIAFLALRIALIERSEMIFFRLSWIWPLALGLASMVAIIAANIPGRLPRSRDSWVIIALGLLLLLCGALRAWKLDWQPLDDDEYASTQAVLSIAETGVPEYAEGIWYTRSPFYHYVTGAFAVVFGPHIWTLRLLSVICGVLTGWLVYHIGVALFRSRLIGLAALALYSLHPFLIYSSHIARFYQMQQLFALAASYFFMRGFIENRSMRDRYLTVALFLGAILSQEISLLMGLSFAACYLIFGKLRGFQDELKGIFSGGLALFVVFIDVLFFKTKCLTRTDGVSPNVEATLAPHFWEPLNLINLFIAHSRLHLILSGFYFISLVWSLRHRDRNLICLHFLLLISVLGVNLFVTSVSFRYLYALIPFWILLSTHGIAVTAEKAASIYRQQRLQPIIWSLALLTVLSSWSVWRIPGSYELKILGDSTGAMQYVRSQIRPGDKVAATEPHPHAALLEIGRVDYDLTVPILYDFVFRKDGRLIDRNGSAEVIGRLGQLQHAFAEDDRLWIVINREKLRSRGKNLRWEYPGARLELFIRKNAELKFRSYLWSVYLWDQNAGRYHHFRNGGDQLID